MIKKIEKLFVESGDDGEAEFIPMISDGEDNFEFLPDENKDIPILALRNVVLFPEVVLPVSLGRKKSLMAIRSAYKKELQKKIHQEKICILLVPLLKS